MNTPKHYSSAFKAQVEDLYAQIGRLPTQVARLSRKFGYDPG